MNVYEAKITYKKVGTVDTDSLDGPDKVYKYVIASGLIDENPEQEHFFVIPLNRKNKPKPGIIRVTLGTASQTLIHPREVFRPCIMASASALIVCHNHPTGDVSPSSADIRVTRQLREAAEIIGIELLDHVIIGTALKSNPDGLPYYSFNDNGLL